MRVLLDSTVLIDYLRGRSVVQRVRVRYERGDDLCTTAINVDEIVRGMRPGERQALDDLVGGLEVLSIGEPEARLAGTWRREQAERGVTLWQADCLIAAAAATSGALIATGNPRDFPMPGVEIEHWPVGR